MIYVFYGSDTDRARAKARALIRHLQEENPDAPSRRLTEGEFSADTVLPLAREQGLFSSAQIIWCDGVFDDALSRESVIENLPALSSSKNTFIFSGGALDARTRRALAGSAETIEEFSSRSGERGASGAGSSLFTLADALGRRDRKRLWALYARARLAGASAEEIHGVLFWQIKSIALALSAASAAEAGISPFVFSKSRAFARHFTAPELADLSSDLVSIYHESRRAGPSLENALERFILSRV